MIVLEDLGAGAGPTTLDVLRGSNPEQAEVCLLEEVRLIGRLHATTLGRADMYQHIRTSLGPPPVYGPTG